MQADAATCLTEADRALIGKACTHWDDWTFYRFDSHNANDCQSRLSLGDYIEVVDTTSPSPAPSPSSASASPASGSRAASRNRSTPLHLRRASSARHDKPGSGRAFSLPPARDSAPRAPRARDQPPPPCRRAVTCTLSSPGETSHATPRPRRIPHPPGHPRQDRRPPRRHRRRGRARDRRARRGRRRDEGEPVSAPGAPRARRRRRAHHYLEYGSYFAEWRRRNALKMWTGWPTFPMVFVKGTLVGGASDLDKLIAGGELKKMLGSVGRRQSRRPRPAGHARGAATCCAGTARPPRTARG